MMVPETQDLPTLPWVLAGASLPATFGANRATAAYATSNRHRGLFYGPDATNTSIPRTGAIGMIAGAPRAPPGPCGWPPDSHPRGGGRNKLGLRITQVLANVQRKTSEHRAMVQACSHAMVQHTPSGEHHRLKKTGRALQLLGGRPPHLSSARPTHRTPKKKKQAQGAITRWIPRPCATLAERLANDTEIDAEKSGPKSKP